MKAPDAIFFKKPRKSKAICGNATYLKYFFSHKIKFRKKVGNSHKWSTIISLEAPFARFSFGRLKKNEMHDLKNISETKKTYTNPMKIKRIDQKTEILKTI